MKKKWIAVLFVLPMMFVSTKVSFAMEEGASGPLTDSLECSNKAAIIKVWFKGIPPKNYKNRIRVDYYSSKGGYIGIYA